MFTVIILRDRAKHIFSEARSLFEPFEEEKLLAFVDWNESPRARTIDDALPGIRPVIKGKKEWRVVVVDSPDEDEADEAQLENPFDFLDNQRGRSLNLSLEESPHSLVRLAHMLLGYPPIGAKDFEAVYSFKDPSVAGANRVERRASELRDAGQPVPTPFEARTILSGMHDLKIHYHEVEYTAEERARHDALKARYEFRGNRPTEVIFISTRRPPETDPHVQLRAVWSAELGRVPSRFVARNDYPSGTRFAVHDMVDREDSNYEKNVLWFWLAVLSVSVNHLPPSAFQADRVYHLGVEVDTAALVATMNTHLSRLGTARDRIDGIFRNPVRRPKTDVSTLLVQQDIPVEFDQLGGESITARIDGYSLATDVPRSESSQWWADYAQIVDRTEALMRRPRRALAAAVYDARLKAQMLLNAEVELTRYELEDLEDDLSRQMGSLAVPATADLLDRKAVRRMIERHHRLILVTIAKRLHATTIGVATGVAIGAWLLGLLPYLIEAGTAQDSSALGDAGLVALLSLVVLFAGGVTALVWQRRELVTKIGDLNRELKAIRAQVYGGAAVFGTYLSDMSTYMRARALILGSAVREDRERTRLKGLDQLKVAITRAMEFERSLITSLGATPVVQKVDGDLNSLDVGNRLRMRRLLQLPSPAGLTVPFNTAGEQIKAPYDFVARLNLDRVSLFERVGEDEITKGVGS
ncbi:MAG: hypothetical protein KF761_13395 [Salinibacterium sp.]|nr:hypothetical protein [Salinibacterium sp.]